MKRMLDVFRFELRRGGRRKGYLAATFGVPLAGILLVLGIRFAGSLPAFNTSQMLSQAMEQVGNSSIGVAGLVDETGQFAPVVQPVDNLTVFADAEAASRCVERGRDRRFLRNSG